MELSREIFRPVLLLGYAWDLARTAVMLGLISLVGSLLGRALSLPGIISRVPTLARVSSTVGDVLPGAPVLVWGLKSILVLILFCESELGPHGEIGLFPVYLLVLPVSGVAVFAIDRLAAGVAVSKPRPASLRDAIVLATVIANWSFVAVAFSYPWSR